MSDGLGVAIMGVLVFAALCLGMLIGGDYTKARIKSNKLIIIDNSSYRCKMVKTLDE